VRQPNVLFMKQRENAMDEVLVLVLLLVPVLPDLALVRSCSERYYVSIAGIYI
jgi:hypothetical protein